MTEELPSKRSSDGAAVSGSRPDATNAIKRSKKNRVIVKAEDEEKVSVVPFTKKDQEWSPQRLDPASMAPGMRIFEDGTTVASHKGYRTVRAMHGAHEGVWYFEVDIQHLGETGRCRVGWQQRGGELQAPVGYDKFGVAYNSEQGHKYHKALREPYGKAYGEGDVVGCLLCLPKGGREMGPELVRYQDVTYAVQSGGKQAPARSLLGSFCVFTVNGESAGVAFVDLLEGTWHPAVSIFTKPLTVTPAEDGAEIRDPHKWALSGDRQCMQSQEARLHVRFDAFRYPPPALGPLIGQAAEMAAESRRVRSEELARSRREARERREQNGTGAGAGAERSGPGEASGAQGHLARPSEGGDVSMAEGHGMANGAVPAGAGAHGMPGTGDGGTGGAAGDAAPVGALQQEDPIRLEDLGVVGEALGESCEVRACAKMAGPAPAGHVGGEEGGAAAAGSSKE